MKVCAMSRRPPLAASTTNGLPMPAHATKSRDGRRTTISIAGEKIQSPPLSRYVAEMSGIEAERSGRHAADRFAGVRVNRKKAKRRQARRGESRQDARPVPPCPMSERQAAERSVAQK